MEYVSSIESRGLCYSHQEILFRTFLAAITAYLYLTGKQNEDIFYNYSLFSFSPILPLIPLFSIFFKSLPWPKCISLVGRLYHFSLVHIYGIYLGILKANTIFCICKDLYIYLYVFHYISTRKTKIQLVYICIPF